MGALKGAFINLGAGLLGALPNVVVFQFNPDRVTRTPSMVQPPPKDDGSGTHNAAQQPGQPSDADCGPDELVDLLSGKCGGICPDGSRANNGCGGGGGGGQQPPPIQLPPGFPPIPGFTPPAPSK